MSEIAIPTEIKQAGPQELGIKWSDGHDSVYGCYNLRLHCRCANCVDEWNGAARLNREMVPTDVHPLTIESVGRYGLKINWSDGHSTGIYAYQSLRDYCECSLCVKAGKS